jgi:hypothetical protein
VVKVCHWVSGLKSTVTAIAPEQKLIARQSSQPLPCFISTSVHYRSFLVFPFDCTVQHRRFSRSLPGCHSSRAKIPFVRYALCYNFLTLCLEDRTAFGRIFDDPSMTGFPLVQLHLIHDPILHFRSYLCGKQNNFLKTKTRPQILSPPSNIGIRLAGTLSGIQEAPKSQKRRPPTRLSTIGAGLYLNTQRYHLQRLIS